MKMKKLSIAGVISLLVFTVFLAACSSNSTGNGGSKSSVKLTFSSVFPQTDHRSQAYDFWAKEVQEKTEGRVEITIHHGQSLTAVTEAYEAITTRVADVVDIATSFVTPKIPDIAPLDLSIAYNPKEWLNVNEKIQPVLEEILEQHNIKYIFPVYVGEMWAHANKPLTSPEDWKGMKMRDIGKWSGEAVKSWGGVPQTVPLSDLVVAIDQKIVDGAYNAWSTSKSTNLHELVSDVTWMGFAVVWEFAGINMDAWNKISPEDQAIMIEVGKEAAVLSEEIANKALEDYVKVVEEKGVKIHYLNDQQKAVFEELAAQNWTNVEKGLSPQGMKLVEILKNQ